ncbi:metal ABC transporter permease [bacterium]|nr:metal ABC transporter permease [bacterium]
MLAVWWEMLAHAFIQRAFVVGILVSLCASLLGVILVLKRYSLIGDGLSHVGFGIVSLASALGLTAPLYVAIPGVALAAIILLRLDRHSHLKSDSAIALISSSALALGVAVTSLTPGLNLDTHSFMFGSILAIQANDVYLSVAACIVILVLFIIYYRKLFLLTFDEDFARATGLNMTLYTNVIAILTAVTIVIGMRMMGVMLISSIIIFPATTAMWWCRSFRATIISAATIGVLSFIIGLYLSYVYNVSTGAAIILVNLFVFILFWLLSKIFVR